MGLGRKTIPVSSSVSSDAPSESNASRAPEPSAGTEQSATTEHLMEMQDKVRRLDSMQLEQVAQICREEPAAAPTEMVWAQSEVDSAQARASSSSIEPVSSESLSSSAPGANASSSVGTEEQSDKMSKSSAAVEGANEAELVPHAAETPPSLPSDISEPQQPLEAPTNEEVIPKAPAKTSRGRALQLPRSRGLQIATHATGGRDAAPTSAAKQPSTRTPDLVTPRTEQREHAPPESARTKLSEALAARQDQDDTQGHDETEGAGGSLSVHDTSATHTRKVCLSQCVCAGRCKQPMLESHTHQSLPHPGSPLPLSRPLAHVSHSVVWSPFASGSSGPCTRRYATSTAPLAE